MPLYEDRNAPNVVHANAAREWGLLLSHPMKTNTLILFAASVMMFGCASHSPSITATKTYTLLPRGGGAPRLQIDLPSHFSMKRYEGPDFDVFYFFDKATKCGMGIYAGYFPSLHSKDDGAADVRRQTGQVGEVPVEWLRWSKDGRYRSEALVHNFFGPSVSRMQPAMVLHIFADAPTEQDIARMETAAATLRLEKGR